MKAEESSLTNICIYGAGSAGKQLHNAINDQGIYINKFFIDDDPILQSQTILGIKIYSSESLEENIKKYNIKEVFFAIPSLAEERRSEILKKIGALPCSLKVIPSYTKLLSNDNEIHPKNTISYEEIMNRGKVSLEGDLVNLTYKDKVILVTGAGGSIGSEICKQLIECSPNKIILFDNSEYAIYESLNELSNKSKSNGIELHGKLGSISNIKSLETAVKDYDIDVLIHSAAYKHVPLVEDNITEGIRNNVLGTKNVIEVVTKYTIPKMILISSDKAVRPTNVMGASKRLCEMLLLESQKSFPDIKFSMVRFGNVIGSSGSVIPLFKNQISRGGPVTVTDRRATRFFMTIDEANKALGIKPEPVNPKTLKLFKSYFHYKGIKAL